MNETHKARLIAAHRAFVEAANTLLDVWDEDEEFGNSILEEDYPERWTSFQEEVYDINTWSEAVHGCPLHHLRQETFSHRTLADVDMLLMGVNQMTAECLPERSSK